MKISKIKSQYIYQELFSYISSQKRKLNIAKYNTFLNKKLDLSLINYKQLFFQNKINEYDIYPNIHNYWNKFKNDFKELIDENSYNLFLNCLSKKKDFILKLRDKDFNMMIQNIHINDEISIELEELNEKIIPRLLLIKNNKLTDKFIKRLREIFNLFSTNGKMSNMQSKEFLSRIGRNNHSDIRYLKSYDRDNDNFLIFEDFIQYYFDLVTTSDDLKTYQDDLRYLGYNKFLDKGKYDLDYLKSHLDEFEIQKPNLTNLFLVLNKKIIKISLLSNIDKLFVDYLNIKQIFLYLKKIDISVVNLNLLINSKIICPNIEELNLYINDNLDYNNKEIIIF